METNNHKLPFLTAKARMRSRYGIDMELDEFIEKAYYIWRSIGNIAINDRRVEVVIPDNGMITLPSDCEILNSARLKHNLLYKSGYDSSGIKTSEQGVPLEYKNVGEKTIKITSVGLEGLDLILEYSAIAIDGDGLPLLNDPEVEAIAANVAKQHAEISLFRHIAGADKILQYIQPEADRLLIAARNDEKITDDGLNKLLDVKSSWDRKTFGNYFNFS